MTSSLRPSATSAVNSWKSKILIVEDEPGMRDVLRTLLEQHGYEVSTAADLPEALQSVTRRAPDVILTDLKLPSGDGLQLLDHAARTGMACPVVVLTAHGSVDVAVDAVKKGAYDFLTKPFDEDRLFITLDRALAQKRLQEENRDLRAEARQGPNLDQLHTASAAMRKVVELARQVAESPTTTVLIQGESGTGKEVLARAIHVHSARREKRFVPIHCAAIPDTLLESELFGYERGAFTGAAQRKKGRIETAEGGTLFLDEIGDLAAHLQVKLLRVIQEKSFERLGGLDPVHADVRLIAATHRDLAKMVEQGTFRADLFYRLNVFSLVIPPLCERPEDIDLLARHFLARQSAAMGKPISGFSTDALAAMKSYGWPGNVRELENAVERAVILCRGTDIRREHLAFPASTPAEKSARETVAESVTLEEKEKSMIHRALQDARNNVSVAARKLGLTRSKLRTRLARHGIRTRSRE